MTWLTIFPASIWISQILIFFLQYQWHGAGVIPRMPICRSDFRLLQRGPALSVLLISMLRWKRSTRQPKNFQICKPVCSRL